MNQGIRNASEQFERLRGIVDEILLAGHANRVAGLFTSVESQARSEGVMFDGRTVLEYFWDLARIGAVAVPGDALDAPTLEMPRMLLTSRGRQLLEKGELSPHDPGKYLAAVRRRILKPDEIALSYLSEAAETWRCGLNRSSAVMLGCACERLVLGLAQALAVTDHKPWSSRVTTKLKKRLFISDLFSDVREALMSLAGQKSLPRELADALDRRLSAIFEHARGLRNQSGHPTGDEVSAEDAEAGLLLFPGFCELVGKLMEQLPRKETATDKGNSDEPCAFARGRQG